MEHTRREFLEAAGAIVAAAANGCSRPTTSTTQLQAAKGVELGVENGALPDYSHDLERYLVRLASDARARRPPASRHSAPVGRLSMSMQDDGSFCSAPTSVCFASGTASAGSTCC